MQYLSSTPTSLKVFLTSATLKFVENVIKHSTHYFTERFPLLKFLAHKNHLRRPKKKIHFPIFSHTLFLLHPSRVLITHKTTAAVTADKKNDSFRLNVEKSFNARTQLFLFIHSIVYSISVHTICFSAPKSDSSACLLHKTISLFSRKKYKKDFSASY